MSFVHLHVHSEYSLLDGLTKIEDLLEKVKNEGMNSVALTDHGAMYGAFRFYIEAKKRGIKPIIGLEAYKAEASRFDKNKKLGNDQFHLTLLAKNLEGYKNLMRLTTLAHLEGYYYKPRIDFELLEEHHEGIIALSGCLNAEIPSALRDGQKDKAEKLLKRYVDIFGEDFYIEIQRIPGIDELDDINNQLIHLSRKYSIPIVATNDVHYLDKDDAYAQEVLLCIQTSHTIYEDRPLTMINTPEFYFKTEKEMQGLFLDLPEAIENSQKIADMCDVDVPHGKWILPIYPLPEEESPEEHLREMVKERTEKRLQITEEAKIRLEYELNIICTKGYATYFLIVQDFVNWAKKNGIAVGPGRGSVAGSLVAYVLAISDINPLDYNVPFERFLNPDRPTPPDIDIDFADKRRDEVLAYVTNKYGGDKVAQIITFGRMEARLAVRDVARALGLPYSQGDRIAKMMPQGKQGFAITIDKALEESSTLKLAYAQEEDVKKVLDIARKLEGVARHSSVHAAGVIIADKALLEYVPLQREAKAGKIITQYDMYCLDLNAVSNNEAVGLMKIDILGLRNLTIIEDALAFVEKKLHKHIDIHNISLDDEKTYKLISDGRTIGVFQLESRGMRRLAKDLKPSKLSDITAMVALYRPGPMDLIPSFLKGKKSERSIRYLHKDLVSVLQETYGVLVYQEQVMEIAHKIAGYSMSEADALRMAMGKKKKALMRKERMKFIERAVSQGYTKKLAEQIFNFIEKFAAYGFNKPHSASYALIAYWTAFMKANYPVEYMTALLTAELQGAAGAQREAKMFQAIEECRSMEINVLPPDINKSEYDFSIEKESIRFGLSAIKNVGKSAIESMLEARSQNIFIGLRDFLSRVDVRRVNKKTVESLIKSGAFDSFGTRASLLTYYPKALNEASSQKKQVESGQYDLFGAKRDQRLSDSDLENIQEFSEDELLLMEKEVIGFTISTNPLSQYHDIIARKVTKKIGEISEDDIGSTHIIAGNISQVRKVTTKKGNNRMAFVSVFDETGSVDTVVFPKIYASTKNIWIENTTVLLKGRINERGDGLTIVVDNVIDLATTKR
ncbi:DNA polymerase III subunit alpha [Candidatus Roizmanbacteria bacterium RIFCSPLOWO2_02_FULL_37_19]|uniref:DNA polymerase III subunit alpha n=1 Tax=Candidatus Roizmanbacteria bacterium RIFCSPHIGHO2_02_FULL_37_24 TaxID=1802037 RepID=A0A1F7GZ05_9BACT|nr:MAG: DNA polymerase III subunit alpha [Candidatus Roizmanbacteria bacterium RIFCSPHIGHO2_01_FULL_38_41]OGK23752.1 MAG: DNA polymerase III subunit alpha [Candidatus Roizmanbacteria bacterium RIFCSPHIGHO2_02_FULL_37_24]OGK32675.1 MAG: DNA polymerase III subunit alpha [Candidatus Roizmanbacteria bacterium RIFCSPHIGHO2_12_FULL_37_23]OGK44759.1 MAG: DNA polymerase III subunit alpha [Candidatus Roizmanbacteria bacterium RIFCSPLOWO2_01_FULL_37_57]OGK53989.1 MAG: DNA polymerase III subunit alpha [Ca